MKNLLISIILLILIILMPFRFSIADDGVTQNEWAPLHLEFPSCDNTDYIVLDGTYHEVRDYQNIKNGFRLIYHINLIMDGVGTISGNKYTVNEVYNQTCIVNALPFKNVINDSFNVIGQGSAPDYHARFILVLTIDKDLNTKIHMEELSSVCR